MKNYNHLLSNQRERETASKNTQNFAVEMDDWTDSRTHFLNDSVQFGFSGGKDTYHTGLLALSPIVIEATQRAQVRHDFSFSQCISREVHRRLSFYQC